MDLTQIVIALIGLLASCLTVFVLPWLRARTGAERWAQLERVAAVAVMAAEQLGGSGEEKLGYAMRQAEGALGAAGLSFDGELVRAQIEAAVLDLKDRF